MSNENSIIKIDGNITKPATKLIDKIANAIGIAYEPTRIKRKAHAEGEVKIFNTLINDKISELEQRTMTRLAREEIKKQENMEAIADQATTKLNQQAKPEEMDNDWITHFFDKCRNVSDQDMQKLWSDILSGEANAPRTYSKRTLDIVSSLDKKEVELFMKLCSFTILSEDNKMYLLILNMENEIYSKAGLDYIKLTHLETIGFIKIGSIKEFAIGDIQNMNIYDYYGTKLKFKFKKHLNNSIYTGPVMFTESGAQLAPICGSEMNSEFIKYAMEYYNNKKNLVGDVVSLTVVE